MSNSSTVLITGAGSGLGYALAEQLLARGLTVYIIDRQVKTCSLSGLTTDKITFIQADISTLAGRRKILLALADVTLDYVIHNAGIVTPIAPLEKLTLRAWRKIIATNVEAPLFLTQQLLPQLNPQARILHISSDCAHYPLAYWIPYCCSKAALSMLAQCLKKELASRHIYVGAVDPGMMDTPMQHYICEKTIDFPEKMTREELMQRQLMHAPAVSAEFCIKLLLESSPEIFTAQEWCMENFKTA